MLFLLRNQVQILSSKPKSYLVGQSQNIPMLHRSFWSEASEWIPMTSKGVCPVHVSSQYGHSRYRLRHFEHKSHGSKPCLGPFTYPLPLYVWSEPMYGFLRDIHRCFLYALVHGCRLPRTIQKPFRCIAGMHLTRTSKWTVYQSLHKNRARLFF